MAKVVAYPYIAAHINGVESFIVGTERVEEFGVGPGMPGTILLIVKLTPCESHVLRHGECPTERRFMVPPTMLAFECGPGQEMDVPDAPPKPTLVLPPR